MTSSQIINNHDNNASTTILLAWLLGTKHGYNIHQCMADGYNYIINRSGYIQMMVFAEIVAGSKEIAYEARLIGRRNQCRLG